MNDNWTSMKYEWVCQKTLTTINTIHNIVSFSLILQVAFGNVNIYLKTASA